MAEKPTGPIEIKISAQTTEVLKVFEKYSHLTFPDILQIFLFCKSYDATVHYIQLMYERKWDFKTVVAEIKKAMPGIAAELGETLKSMSKGKSDDGQ